MLLRSRLGNAITRSVYRIFTGHRIYDTQTGLRAFSDRLIDKLLELPGERYEYEMNMLLACPKLGIPMLEEKIKTIYNDNNASSHFSTVKDSFLIYKEILKFSASSFVSFLLDYVLYAIFVMIIGSGAGGLTTANISARVISAYVNYSINRKLVFKSTDKMYKTAVQYFMLACAILIGNTVILNFLVLKLGMNSYAAKVFTEILLFVFSLIVQKCFIFRRQAQAK